MAGTVTRGRLVPTWQITFILALSGLGVLAGAFFVFGIITGQLVLWIATGILVGVGLGIYLGWRKDQ